MSLRRAPSFSPGRLTALIIVKTNFKQVFKTFTPGLILISKRDTKLNLLPMCLVSNSEECFPVVTNITKVVKICLLVTI